MLVTMRAATETEASPDLRRRAHRFVVAMGIVAMFGDFTYEGARSISGPYLAMLGASATVIGLVAGLGELVGYALRVVAGWVADRTEAHWPLVAAGYGINLVAVPALALTERWELAALLVVLERLGKAIRSPSKSALLAGPAAHVGEGKAFGLEEALDQIGAVGGPLIVAGVIALRGGTEVDGARTGFACLLVPVLLTLAVLRVARRRFAMPIDAREAPGTTPPAALGARFYLTLAAVSLLGFGMADWAILAFHARHTELVSGAGLPVAYAMVMGLDGAAALVLGALFDRIGLRALALAGVAAAAAPVFVFGSSVAELAVGAALWAVGLGALESISKAAVSKAAPPAARGRAFGLFFGVFGVAWWLGSSVLGALYDRSLAAVVLTSTIAQALGALALVALARRTDRTAAA